MIYSKKLLGQQRPLFLLDVMKGIIKQTVLIPQVLKISCRNYVKRNELPARPKITPEMEKDIEEKFMHGGRGPGGQKINKSNSKVQLRHIPTGIVVNCQETRSRDKNRKIARLKLAMEIERFKNDDNMSARDIGLLKLNQQNKKSAMKRSQLKHEIHKKENELNRLKQLEDDEELIKKMFK